MPRIPISDIPNAPRPVAQPTGGNLSGVNLGRAQSLLQQDTISPDAFQGPARGLQSIAQGIGDLANGSRDVSRAALQLQEQVDENEMWKAMDTLNEAHGAVQADIAANPTNPAEYGPKMQKGLDEAYQRIIANKNLSEGARAKIDQRYNRFRIESVGQMQLAGAKTLFSQNKEYVGNYITQKIEAGDTEGAIKVIDGYRGMLFFEQEADGLAQHAREKGDVLKVMQTMQSDPDEAERMAEDEKATPNIPAMMRLGLSDQADTERRKQDAQSWEMLVEGIANRTINSPEDAANVFGEKFAVKYRSKIKSAFAASPDMEQVKGNYLRINEEIGKLDPKDPEAVKKAFDMRVEIYSSLPEGFRKDALDALNARVNSKPESLLRSQLSNAISMARTAGVFGEWDEKDFKKGDQKALAKKGSAFASAFRIQEEGEAWLKQNPGAKSEDLNAWFNQRMSREIKQAEPNFWQRYAPEWLGGWPSASPTPSAKPIGSKIDEKMKQHEAKAAPTPAPQGARVTSYGYKGDTTPDSYSAAGIGSFTKKLHEDSLAISPDIEAQFKEMGIEPKDWVELTMSDGTTLRKQWHDRTAKSYKGKALTGRFDFYSKGGPSPLNGREVVSFRKVEA